MTIATLFLALVATSGQPAETPVILDFTASWCGPCQQMRPVVDQLIEKRYPIKPVDFDTKKSLVKKYGISAVPTFVAVAPDGRELGRVAGYCPAGDLVSLYKEAKAKLAQEAPDEETDEADEDRDAGRKVRQIGDEKPEKEVASGRKNPLPWETVVRIKISNQNMMEFGSGTVVYSTPEESIILTCAHIFKVGERGPKIPVSRFNLPIEVHLFDGQLHGTNPAVVHFLEKVPGEAIDYDFNADVGLIRIRPGRKLAATPVVPAGWNPKAQTKMTTVGCSEGRDATAWSTWVTKPLVRGVVDNNPAYEAIECAYAPKQGRSGGGLYTLDGMLAGVCDFAEPSEGHGLYASPRVIQKFLDKNNLTVCYNTEAGRPRDRAGAMVAQGTKVGTKVRAQSSSEPEDRPKKLMIPTPEQLNIPSLAGSEEAPTRRRARSAWTPEHDNAVATKDRSGGSFPSRDEIAQSDDEIGPRATEMKMLPETESDPFDRAVSTPSAVKSTPRAIAQQEAKPKSSNLWKSASPSQASGSTDRVNR